MHPAVRFFVLELHFYLFLIGYLVRVIKNRHIGKYNLNAPRQKSYIVKSIL